MKDEGNERGKALVRVFEGTQDGKGVGCAQKREGENRTRVRRIFLNFGFLTGGRIVGEAFTFLLVVVLSRVFGQEGIGQYSFAMGLTGFFVVFGEFGLYAFTVKEVSRCEDSLGACYGPIMTLRLILSAIVYGALLLTLPFLPFSFEFKVVIGLIGAYQLMHRLVGGAVAVFVGREDTHLAAIIEASLKAFAALAVIGVVMAGGTLVTAMAALSAVTAIQILVAYGLVCKKYERPLMGLSLSSLTHTVRQTLPYGLSALLIQVRTRVDVVFLGFFMGAAAAGIYNVAYRVVFLLMLIPQFASYSVFPLASRLYKTSTKELEILFRKAFNLLILIGLPVGAGLWLISADLIKVVFGEAFIESSEVLGILAVLLILNFLSTTLAVFLMSCDRQVETTKSQWIAACMNVLGILVLIPAFGVKGAAFAAVISEGILVVLLLVRLRAVLGWPRVSSRLVISGVGVASFCVPFTLFPSTSLGVVIPASLLLYLTVLTLFQETRRNEVRTVVSLLREGWGEVPRGSRALRANFFSSMSGLEKDD